MLLRDVVFSVRNVDFATFQPWVNFIVRVVNEGAPCEAQDRLRNALLGVINCGPRTASRRGASGPLASVQFQKLVREHLDPAGVGELAHLSAEDRETFFNREVYQRFVQSLPCPSYGTDERGRVVLRAEAPPVLDASSVGKRQFSLTKSDVARREAERISELAQENELKCHAVICALANDRLARNLFRCSQCQAFFIAKAAHRRTHNFCSAAHRRAYDLAHRDPKAMAVYMRNYRRNKMVQNRKRKKAKTTLPKP